MYIYSLILNTYAQMQQSALFQKVHFGGKLGKNQRSLLKVGE